MTYTNGQVLSALSDSDIGGGIGHEPAIRVNKDAIIARTPGQFTSNAGDPNAFIWIPQSAKIDLTGWSGTVRATIASDRGSAGSKGGLIYTRDHGDDSPAWDGGSGMGVLQLRGEARMSGVRFRGPFHDHYDDPRYPGYIPLDSGDATERRQKRNRRLARGMSIYSDDVVVDNCELYGWPNQAIMVGARGTAASPHLHHLYCHDCMMVGYGYAIDIIRGSPLIEDSYFNATRHSIVGFGYDDCGYTVENCVFGPMTYSHGVDMHCLAENGFDGDLTAGDRVEVRNCTFCFTEGVRGNPTQAIVFRGYPEDEYVTENNTFPHEIDGEEPCDNVSNSSGHAVPYRQVNVSGWNDWTFRNNEYGPDAAALPHVGASIILNPEWSGPSLPGDLSPRRRMEMLTGLSQLEESLTTLRTTLVTPDSDTSDPSDPSDASDVF